ncbi:MAG: cation:proton antiporter regulatory subunit [Desulfotignum sp.]|nr:cation:proton antiporter regulatory subunit [Desulfotignum sp.]
MADLPGVGKKISFQTAEQQKIVVIVHHSGKRDLYFFQNPDEDEADYFLSLTSEETRELGAQLLGATYQPVDDEKMQIFQKQLVMEWIKLTPESPFVDKQIAESRIRSHTGASIIAVMQGDDMTVSPDIDFVLKAGDTVMTAGKRDQIRRFEAMANGKAMEGDN